MSFTIQEVQTPQELKKFIDLPWKLYQNFDKWIPPLKKSVYDLLSPKHPFYKNAKMKKYLLLDEKRKPVGRIAFIRNEKYLDIYKNACAHFGLFECIDDSKAAKTLFDQVIQDAHQEGLKEVQGPYNPSTNYECGLLVDGYQYPPSIMMPYNPPYYEKLYAENGMSKAMDLLAYGLPTERVAIPEKILAMGEALKSKLKVKVRHFNKKKWKDEVESVFDIYNDAWEENWGFVPFTKEEFVHMTDELKLIVDESISLMLEVDGKPVGFSLPIPDYNQVFEKIPSGRLFPTGIFKLLRASKYIDGIRFIIMGVKKEYQGLGLTPLLYTELNKAILEKRPDIKHIELGWVLENNERMTKPILGSGASPYKRYRIFTRKIHSPEASR